MNAGQALEIAQDAKVAKQERQRSPSKKGKGHINLENSVGITEISRNGERPLLLLSWKEICPSLELMSVQPGCADSGTCWPIIMVRYGTLPSLPGPLVSRTQLSDNILTGLQTPLWSDRSNHGMKKTSAPRLTKSMRIAMHDLKLKQLFVIHAGEHSFPLAENIKAVPVSRLSEILA